MLSKKLIRTLKAKNPKIKVDLTDIFGRFPKEGADDLKQEIGGAIIERIRERAGSGNFLEQSRGAGSYSKSYTNSFEFKVFGKSKGNVNMKASGDMLRAIDITNETKDGIEIGFNDRLEANKAHGHITGAVGKTRDFFGLTDTDIKEIRREFNGEVKDRLALQEGSITAGQTRRDNESLFDFLRRVIGERGNS